MEPTQQSIFESQKKRIERDITSFSDPGTLVEVTAPPRRFVATWTMQGSPREATFLLSPYAGISASINGKKQDYASFLADEGMSNLRNVAEMTLHSARPSMFVSTLSRRKDVEEEPPSPATDYLTNLVEQPGSGTTRVVMVTGEAGAGKTHVLRQLVRQQADRYLRGKTKQLFLYVNAQGRSLARLDEAFATELQDLRVSLTYHSIETLAKVGILVPVIDGFDELLGVSGYDDPFNSLAGLLENLDGEGSLIASARSVYYEAEFLARAGKISTQSSQSWEHIPVEILEWDENVRASFLKEISNNRMLSEKRCKELEKDLKTAFSKHQELAAKPLFFVRVADLVLTSTLPPDEDLPSALASAYLERELREKLLDRQHEPLLSRKQLEFLMREMALEMWSQETRELDLSSVREVADYVLQVEELGESVQKIVVDRMPTLAFLAHNGRHARILFEHEVFFFYFLSRSLVAQYLNGEDLRLALSRSALPEFVAERVAIELHREGALLSMKDLQNALDRLGEAGSQRWLRSTQIQENAGLIVLALLREYAERESGGKLEGLTIRSVTLPGGHLRNIVMKECRLLDVSVRRVDLTATTFLDCHVSNFTMIEPVVNVSPNGTRLELRGLDGLDSVSGIVVLEDSSRRVAFAPKEVASILRRCGAPIASENEDARKIPESTMNLLNRLMRAYGRANPVCEADPALKNVINDPDWPMIKGLLIEHGLVKEETREAAGSPKRFFRRRFLPGNLMGGTSKLGSSDSSITRFWDDLESQNG